jgi:hypothetical protein
MAVTFGTKNLNSSKFDINHDTMHLHSITKLYYVCLEAYCFGFCKEQHPIFETHHNLTSTTIPTITSNSIITLIKPQKMSDRFEKQLDAIKITYSMDTSCSYHSLIYSEKVSSIRHSSLDVS